MQPLGAAAPSRSSIARTCEARARFLAQPSVWTVLKLELLAWEPGAQAYVPRRQPPFMKLVHKDITFESVPAMCLPVVLIRCLLPSIHASCMHGYCRKPVLAGSLQRHWNSSATWTGLK